MQIHDVAGSPTVISCLVSSIFFYFFFQFRKKRICTGKISLPLCRWFNVRNSFEGGENRLAYRVCLITVGIAFFDRGLPPSQPVNQSISQSVSQSVNQFHGYHIIKIYRRTGVKVLATFRWLCSAIFFFNSSTTCSIGQNDLWEREVYSTGWKVWVNSYLRREKFEEIVARLE